jgi:hypothetical protein
VADRNVVSDGTKCRGLRMKIIVAIGATIGVLWLADVLLNDGRYAEVLDRGMTSLISK